MKKVFLILIRELFLISLAFAQERKPPALINKLVTLGPIEEVQKQIVFNHLQAVLSEKFELVSQRRFEEAQNKAFEELDYDQCTEENCIRFIQDTLQVESFFSLQLLQEKEITQLTLQMLDLDRKIVKTDICSECSTLDLNEKVTDLIEEMYKEIDFDRLDLPFDDRLDPSEKYPELVSSIRPSVQVYYELGLTSLKLIFPDSKKTEATMVNWGLLGAGVGLGKDYFVEFRTYSGSGKTDKFYFVDDSYHGFNTNTAYGNFELTKNVVYYSPNPDDKWTMGFGISQLNFTFDTSQGEKKLSLASLFFDFGFQQWGEDFPVALKLLVDPYGLAMVPSLGFRFFF